MAPPLLQLRQIFLTFGGPPLLDGADLTVSARDRICLVGRNGSGKSTFLKIAAGLLEADGGERFLQPGCRIEYLPQDPDLSAYTTVGAYLESGLGPTDDVHGATGLIMSLGVDPATRTSGLSGGERRRAALARILAVAPDILLLDEPTNHLDLPAIEWLESTLRASSAALVLISHDRRFLETLSRRTVWLDEGETRILEHGFAGFEEWRDDILEQEQIGHHKLKRKIVAEEDWVRYGVSGRRKRNQRRLKELYGLKTRSRTVTKRPAIAEIETLDSELSGRKVIDVHNLRFGYDDKPLVDGFTTRILRGEKIGLIGPNGSGKTTLIKLMTGQLAPDSGQVKLGTNLVQVSLDQNRAELREGQLLQEYLTEGRGDQVMVGDTPRHVISYMKDFLFTANQARTPVSRLSGGEQGRLMLARALARPSNIMVLDEPTNDLDLETLDVLQELLTDYEGTLLLVSHDRDFLDRICTSVIMAEGDGIWRRYAGGYSDMVAQRGSGVAPPVEARLDRPARVKPMAPAKSKNSPRKMSFKDKHALEKLPGEIEQLQQQIDVHQAVLADPDLYQSDPEKFVRMGDELDAFQTKLSLAEEEWLRLELLQEELSGG